MIGILSMRRELKEELGLDIKEVCFSEPQAGKSRCDTYAAIIKKKVARYVNSGFDVDTPKKFAEATVSGEGIANVLVLLGDVQGGKLPNPETPITGIKSLSHFQLNDTGVVARKMPNFGDGKKFNLKYSKLPSSFNYELVNECHLDENYKLKRKTTTPILKKSPKLTQERLEPEIEDLEDTDFIEEKKSGVYVCPNFLCDRLFKTDQGLTNHKMIGKCKLTIQHPTIEEQVTSMTISAYGTTAHQNLSQSSNLKMIVKNIEQLPEVNLPMLPIFGACVKWDFSSGFALPDAKARVTCTEDMTKWLKDIFEKGKGSRTKAKPAQVAMTMRLQFPGQKTPKADAIKSKFSRWNAQDKKQTSIAEQSEMDEEDEAAIIEHYDAIEEAQAWRFDMIELINEVEAENIDTLDHPMIVSTNFKPFALESSKLSLFTDK